SDDDTLDDLVTRVQTCPLPCSSHTFPGSLRVRHVSRVPQTREFLQMSPESTRVPSTHLHRTLPEAPECAASPSSDTSPGRPRVQIGRASCRKEWWWRD